MSLKALLQETLAASQTKFPPEALEVMRAADKELQTRGVGQNALGVGDMLPDATLTSAKGDPVSIKGFNTNGPLIISFYRGGWCPYCNLELRAYQERLADIHATGSQFVAVSPEKPDNSLTTSEKNALIFPVLSDSENQFARAMGIVFELPEGLQNLFNSFGMNLPSLNSDTGWTLPVPATFVVSGSGEIVLADVDADYTRRLEPSVAIAALKACATAA